ncbi:MAG: hypothetical protein AB1772_07935 [Candidatus Zixiibacteriota bacterium]
MPFCPRCRYEYLPTVSVCPDCEEKLVAVLPLEPEELDETGSPEDWEEPDEPEELESYDNWIPLARFTSTQYADMVLGALHSKDIPAVLSDQSGHFGATGQSGPSSYPSLIGGAVTLFVPQEFAVDADHEARIILGEDWDKAKVGGAEH